MSNVRVFYPEDLGNSKNAWVDDFRKNNWVSPNTDREAKNHQAKVDAVRGSSFNGLQFRHSEEFKQFGNTPEALKSFFMRAFSAQCGQEYLEKAYEKISAFHHQGVWGFGVFAINAAIRDITPGADNGNSYTCVDRRDKENVDAITRNNDLVFRDDHFFLINRSFEIICVADKDPEKDMAVPGTIRAEYVLTDLGFKIIEVTVSNSLLAEIIMNKSVKLSPKKLARAAAEEAVNAAEMAFEKEYVRLRQKLALPSHRKVRDAGIHFLTEADTLYQQTRDGVTAKILTDAINSVNELLEAGSDTNKVKGAVKKISESYATLNRSPWARALKTLLWNVASAVLAAAGVLAVSSGFGAPVGIGLGATAAATSLYGTGTSLFGQTRMAKMYDGLREKASMSVKVLKVAG